MKRYWNYISWTRSRLMYLVTSSNCDMVLTLVAVRHWMQWENLIAATFSLTVHSIKIFTHSSPLYTLIINYPAKIYLSKVNNRNNRKSCEICSNLTIETPGRRQWRRSGVSIVNFEQVSHLFLVIRLLTLTVKCLLGIFFELS